jgi:hypothetical protein
MTAKIKAQELFEKHNKDYMEATVYVRKKISNGRTLWDELYFQTRRFWEEVIDEIYKL